MKEHMVCSPLALTNWYDYTPMVRQTKLFVLTLRKVKDSMKWMSEWMNEWMNMKWHEVSGGMGGSPGDVYEVPVK